MYCIPKIQYLYIQAEKRNTGHAGLLLRCGDEPFVRKVSSWFTTLDSADAAPFGTISDALNQLNYTMSRTCPQCEGRIVSTLDTNTRSKEFRRPKPNEQLRKLRHGMWRDEKQAATRMPGGKEAPAQKQGSYAPDGSGHNSQQPATAAKLQLRNSGFPKLTPPTVETVGFPSLHFVKL